MKDVLNTFQFDWAATPATLGLKPESLRNKTVFISGHAVARAIAYTVLTLNDKLKLNTKVILASTDEKLLEEIPAGVRERDDFTSADIFHADDIKQRIDLIIFTGLCGAKIDESFDGYKAEATALKNAVNLACEKKIKRIIFLSDSRVYGKGENKFRAFAETEMGFASPSDYGTQFLRTLESDFIRLTSERKISTAILRTGVVLGGDSGAYNGLDEVFDAVAHGREATLHNTDRQITFTYMTDVFAGITYALEKKLEGVYNLASADSTVSTGMLCAMLHDIFGSQAKITLTDNGDFEGNALNCGKIEFAGFAPNISLKIALQISVLSYLENFVDNFYFPDEHMGRVKAIQQVLMAYLLEVDRICKKHDIQWYLGGGTLLGAARHKGFIPWDDDVDIMMLREDYDKFLEVAAAELPDGMTLSDPKKDKYYNYCYAKLRLEDTVFATDFSKHHKGMSNGFAFDIFCHDKTANSKIGQKLHSQLTLFWLAMVFNKWNHRRVYNGKKVQSAISNFCKNIFPLRFSMRMLLFTLEMFKHKKNAKYLYDGMGKSVHKGGFDRTFLDDEIRVDFCGYKMPVPAKYTEYLTNHYGDYMELSPLSTRLMGHEITLSDLGKYAGFQISNIYANSEHVSKKYSEDNLK